MGNPGMNTKIKDLFKIKGRPLITIGPNETVDAAIQKLVENNIGALPVCDAKGTMLGIISERDLLKECSQRSGAICNTLVKDAMTQDIVVAVPEDDLDYVVGIMTQKGIRHLPIMVGAKLESIISIRDIVEVQLEEFKGQARFLSDYISGNYG
jgi:CBS domain-containing protein